MRRAWLMSADPAAVSLATLSTLWCAGCASAPVFVPLPLPDPVVYTLQLR